MPFFSRNPEPVEEPAPAPVHEEPPKRHGGILGSLRHRDPSPTPTDATRSTRSSTSRHSGEVVDDGSTIGKRRSLLHRSFGNGNGPLEMDPSIVAARERVMSAEAAEREADRALMAARESVRQAREQVRRLELEAEEEARRAKIKQFHAKEVSKRGKQLGRKLTRFAQAIHNIILLNCHTRSRNLSHQRSGAKLYYIAFFNGSFVLKYGCQLGRRNNRGSQHLAREILSMEF